MDTRSWQKLEDLDHIKYSISSSLLEEKEKEHETSIMKIQR